MKWLLIHEIDSDSKMKIDEVSTNQDEKDFLETARIIYSDDRNWVCPLDIEIKRIFDPKKNHYFQHGLCKRWILKNNNNKLIGRVAAFINYKKVQKSDFSVGGLGFFECVDDVNAATILFDHAVNWLRSHDMLAVDGPINFGENDQYWGLLTEGFTSPSYGMNYHKPYYLNLFESYGFRPLYSQLTNTLHVNQPFPDRFDKIARWVRQKKGYEFRHFKRRRLKKFSTDFITIYNDAWSNFNDFTPLSPGKVNSIFQKMKFVLKERFIWFAYINGKPASFLLVLPDVNQLIKPFNGKISIIEGIKLIGQRKKKPSRLRAVVMGTKKEFQKHGLESALFIHLKEEVFAAGHYEELELSWVGDFNKEMLAIHKATGATFSKKHVTLRYIFKRHNIV